MCVCVCVCVCVRVRVRVHLCVHVHMQESCVYVRMYVRIFCVLVHKQTDYIFCCADATCVCYCVCPPYTVLSMLPLGFPLPPPLPQVSRVFDPLMYLSLPLPVEKTRWLEVRLVRVDPQVPIERVSCVHCTNHPSRYWYVVC